MSKEWEVLHTTTMPVIALRGLTVFPNVLIHFEVSRDISIKALETAMSAGSPVFLVGQKDIGVETPDQDDLYQVGTISSPDARTLVIQPWDTKLLKEIQKAIQVSDLGINPQNDGRVIRLVFPQLTEERRKDLTKQVRKYAEEAKVAMRNIRRDAMDYVKAAKKKSEITEDDQKKAEKDLQDLTDQYIKKVDEACAAKEKELMAS